MVGVLRSKMENKEFLDFLGALGASEGYSLRVDFEVYGASEAG